MSSSRALSAVEGTGGRALCSLPVPEGQGQRRAGEAEKSARAKGYVRAPGLDEACACFRCEGGTSVRSGWQADVCAAVESPATLPRKASSSVKLSASARARAVSPRSTVLQLVGAAHSYSNSARVVKGDDDEFARMSAAASTTTYIRHQGHHRCFRPFECL